MSERSESALRGYEPPAIEKEMKAEDVEREAHYAGVDPSGIT